MKQTPARDWKGVLRDLQGGLMLHGFAAVSWHRQAYPPGVWLNTTAEDDLLVFPGRGIHFKEVRTNLWRWRHERSVLRERGFLWAAYNAEVDLTAVGLGTVVTPAVATRMSMRSEDFMPLGTIHASRS